MFSDFVKIFAISGVVFSFGFGLWRTMRSEYESEKILDLSLRIFISWIFWGLAAFLVLKRAVGIYEWAGFLGALLTLRQVTLKYEWDFWEWLDSIIPRTVLGLGFGYLILRPDWLGLALWGSMTLIWLIQLAVSVNYRSFAWYKSGKMGLVGLLGIIGWAIVQIAFAGTRLSEIYWGDISVSQIVCGFVISITLVTLYLRSGRKLNTWPTKNK